MNKISKRGSRRSFNRLLRTGAAWQVLLALLLPALLAGCASLTPLEYANPYPTEYLPTLIALTMAANGPASQAEATSTSSPTQTPTASQTPPATRTLQPSQTATALASSPTLRLAQASVSPSSTPLPEIPEALLQIRNLGALSRVTSPLHLYAYIKTGAGGRVLIELLGEDNRSLYRELKVISYVEPGGSTSLSTDLDFEIASTAEMGRLRLSIADEHSRTVAINSVPLVLLSIGDPDIISPIDVLAPIAIQQPMPKKLIQGGKVLVTGLARSGGMGTLMVKLVASDGKEVGSRLAGVQAPAEGGYGSFAVEVPYTVSQPTPVLLVVQEGGQSFDDPIYLTSLEIVVSP